MSEAHWSDPPLCEHDEYEAGECVACGAECEHADIEDFQCVACGEDRREDQMAMAYDRCKGSYEAGY